MKAIAAAACVGLVLATTHVRATDPQPDRVASPFWSALSSPEAQRSHDLLEQARSELRAASGAFPLGWGAACKKLSAMAAPLDLPGFAHKRSRIMSTLLHESMRRLTHVENAVARLREAERLTPRDPDVLLTLGSALQAWERPGALANCDTQRRDTEAIEVLERLRELHPNYRPSTVAFELAIVYTRSLQFRRAAQCYADGAPLELHTEQLSILFSNWAEVTMLAGDLVDAVRLYERAIAAAGGGREYLLPHWGLAVALDRLGERETALDNVTRALHADQGSMGVLHSDSVFFEPESEIHYYEALGHEARARLPRADALEELGRAAQSWQAFFATGGGDTPWASAARDNLTRIEAEITPLREAAAAPETQQPPRPRSRGRR